MGAAGVAGANEAEDGEERVGHVAALLAHAGVLASPQAPQQDAERVGVGALCDLQGGGGVCGRGGPVGSCRGAGGGWVGGWRGACWILQGGRRTVGVGVGGPVGSCGGAGGGWEGVEFGWPMATVDVQADVEAGRWDGSCRGAGGGWVGGRSSATYTPRMKPINHQQGLKIRRTKNEQGLKMRQRTLQPINQRLEYSSNARWTVVRGGHPDHGSKLPMQLILWRQDGHQTTTCYCLTLKT